MFEIYSFFSTHFFWYFFVFSIASFLSWFMPGFYLLSKSKQTKEYATLVAYPLGIALFALVTFIFGYLGIRFLIYIYVSVFTLLLFKEKLYKKISLGFTLTKFQLGVLLLGVFSQLLAIFPSGFRSAEGIKYYFVNIFDGVFHLALGRSIITSFPPQQPGSFDLPVSNYHYLSNLTIAEISRVWHLPINHVHFHFVTVLLAVVIGLLVARLLHLWSKSAFTVSVGLIFYFFVGEITWLIDMILGSNSPAPFEAFIDNGLIQFMNPPQAFAKMVFLASLLLWSKFWKKSNYYLAVILSIMTASLVGFKIYFGIIVGLGLLAVFLFRLLSLLIQRKITKERIQIQLLPLVFIAFLTAMIGLIIYFPVNAAAGGLYFSFLNWPKEFLGFTKLNWNEWWLRLQVYEAAGNVKALVVWYGLAAAIFVGAIFHVKFVALLAFFKKWRQKLQIEEVVFLLIPSLVCLFIGMNFLQSSGEANSFNFILVALVPMTLITPLILTQSSTMLSKVVFVVAVAVLSVQSVLLGYFFVKNYYQGFNSYTYTLEHQQALAYLRSLDDSVVLQTHPENHINSNTPYLYFFTGKKNYFGGIQIQESHNQPVKEKKEVLDAIFTYSIGATYSAQLAHDAGISHVLLSKVGNEAIFYPKFSDTATQSAYFHWQAVFDNEEVAIFEIIAPE